MTTSKRIEMESKIRDHFYKCKTKEELDRTAIDLLAKYTDEAAQILITDNYLRMSQRLLEGKSNNTKTTNEYSWLDYDGLKKRESKDKEIGLAVEKNNE